jgi:hypothetical protein
MIELRSPDLLVELDPDHGAEITELTDLRSGLALLGHPPFEPEPPCSGDLDELSWTARYRGGWQILAPNAGNSCDVGGVRHGFHGRASVDRWELISHETDRAVLRWLGHGLELTRVVSLTGDTVAVELSWTATTDAAPLIAVEHIVFGRTLLEPACEIAAVADAVADAVAYELSETDGPLRPPPDLARWPALHRRDGRVEVSGERSLEQPRASLATVTGWSMGQADLTNRHAGVAIQLEWDAAKLGAVWLWEEVRASGGLWGTNTELLGFEPASVPHSLGLARAIAEGQAWWARPGEHDRYRLTLRVAHQARVAVG